MGLPEERRYVLLGRVHGARDVGRARRRPLDRCDERRDRVGIDYANNLSLSQWLTYKPTDALNQLVAEAHVYGGNTCASTTCFNSDYAPVAAQVPLQLGETGETYDASSCGSSNVSTFMNWADAHGVGYQAWVWETWGNCSSLISDYNGTAANTYANWVKTHYATLP